MTDDIRLEVEPDPALMPWRGRVRVALVLGSGFGGLADEVDSPEAFAYADLPSFPRPAAGVPGHAGRLLFGAIAGVPSMVFSGRVHSYQGVSALDAAYPARLASALGAETLIVTNAAGGVSPALWPGTVVLISDHINLRGDNPLTGWPGPDGGTPFVPMRDAYDPGLRELARETARSQDVELAEGVYAGLLGPSFETPAEVAYLRGAGADVVGMSTVPEVIAARALGLRVMGFSLVANAAAGHGLSHDEVLEAGRSAEGSLTRLLLGILRGL